MTRKRIYIAGAITRGVLADNVNRATRAFYELFAAGFAPFCPHWSVYAKECCVADWEHSRVVCYGSAQPDNRMAHGDWLDLDLAWVAVAEAVLRLPGESTGADAEVAHAKSLGIPVFHSIDEAKAWLA